MDIHTHTHTQGLVDHPEYNIKSPIEGRVARRRLSVIRTNDGKDKLETNLDGSSRTQDHKNMNRRYARQSNSIICVCGVHAGV
jgi:hypothetical protein